MRASARVAAGLLQLAGGPNAVRARVCKSVRSSRRHVASKLKRTFPRRENSRLRFSICDSLQIRLPHFASPPLFAKQQLDTMTDLGPILETISSKRQELESELAPGGQLDGFDGLTSEQRFVNNLDPQVCDLYRGVAKVMSRFRSGKPPKAFKIIPTLSNWEQILELTEPNNWTAASIYEGTKLFASNLRNDMAQKFYNIILLPRLRDDISEYKKLNFHMYNALKRALYKPAAFYKGIILPLCEDSAETTLREAVIISSVIKKTHVPLLHSAAALLKIAEMPYSSVRCVFMMDLVSKNYALPYRVIDAVVDYFIRCGHDGSATNVQWYQLLLKFCQLYDKDMSDEQRAALAELSKKRERQDKRHHDEDEDEDEDS
jgi:essential nuclear protein 1